MCKFPIRHLRWKLTPRVKKLFHTISPILHGRMKEGESKNGKYMKLYQVKVKVQGAMESS